MHASGSEPPTTPLGEHLSRLTDAGITHAPCRGVQPAEQDVPAGNVDTVLAPYGQRDDVYARRERLKILVTLSADQLERIHQAVARALRSPGVHKGLRPQGLLLAEPQPLEAVGRVYCRGTARQSTYRQNQKCMALWVPFHEAVALRRNDTR
jgi:hypothetical protein